MVPTAVSWSINYSGQILDSNVMFCITFRSEWLVTIQKLKLIVYASS